MSPREAIRRLQVLSDGLDNMTVSVIEDTSEDIIGLNQQQLYSGRLADGSPITPSYLEDPYFKTREAAQRYSDWKDEITPNENRPKGVPNLFITGRFYESWTISADAQKITYQSSDPNAADIEDKFSERIYGLDDDNMNQYRWKTFFPLLKAEIESQTGLKFS